MEDSVKILNKTITDTVVSVSDNIASDNSAGDSVNHSIAEDKSPLFYIAAIGAIIVLQFVRRNLRKKREKSE